MKIYPCLFVTKEKSPNLIFECPLDLSKQFRADFSKKFTNFHPNLITEYFSQLNIVFIPISVLLSDHENLNFINIDRQKDS